MKFPTRVTPDLWLQMVVQQVVLHREQTRKGYPTPDVPAEEATAHWRSGLLLAEDLVEATKHFAAFHTLNIDEVPWSIGSDAPEPKINAVRRAWTAIAENREELRAKSVHDLDGVMKHGTALGYLLCDVWDSFIAAEAARVLRIEDDTSFTKPVVVRKPLVVVNPKYVKEPEIFSLMESGYHVVRAEYYSDPVKFVKDD